MMIALYAAFVCACVTRRIEFALSLFERARAFEREPFAARTHIELTAELETHTHIRLEVFSGSGSQPPHTSPANAICSMRRSDSGTVQCECVSVSVSVSVSLRLSLRPERVCCLRDFACDILYYLRLRFAPRPVFVYTTSEIAMLSERF